MVRTIRKSCLLNWLIINDVVFCIFLFAKKRIVLSPMKNLKRGILFIVYLLFWLVAFELMRVFFMLFNLANGFSCSASEFFGAMLHGLRMDLSTVAYIGIFLVPFLILF